MALTEEQKDFAVKLSNQLIAQLGITPQPAAVVTALITAACCISLVSDTQADFHTAVQAAHQQMIEHNERTERAISKIH